VSPGVPAPRAISEPVFPTWIGSVPNRFLLPSHASNDPLALSGAQGRAVFPVCSLFGAARTSRPCSLPGKTGCLCGFRRCRRQDSNLRHADYDSAAAFTAGPDSPAYAGDPGKGRPGVFTAVDGCFLVTPLPPAGPFLSFCDEGGESRLAGAPRGVRTGLTGSDSVLGGRQMGGATGSLGKHASDGRSLSSGRGFPTR
jgi:hypothetical protein